jgi:hypothetical protein
VADAATVDLELTMTTKESILQALKHQKQNEESADIVELKNEWIQALRYLFSQFENWLKDAVEQQLLQVRFDQRGFQEERIGTYVAPVMDIVTPAGIRVHVAPRARFVVGAMGRVDVESPPNRAIVIRTDKGRWQIAELDAPRGWRYKDLSEETFWDMLGRLIG